MRTFDEIMVDVYQANSVADTDDLLRLAEELNTLDTPEANAKALLHRGMASTYKSDYPAALEYLPRSLGLYEELGDRDGEARAIINIGNVSSLMGNHTEALVHYQKALDLVLKLGDPVFKQ